MTTEQGQTFAQPLADVRLAAIEAKLDAICSALAWLIERAPSDLGQPLPSFRLSFDGRDAVLGKLWKR